jgi:hypothetical protein
MYQLPPGRTGDVRITFKGGGYWSYLGTDINGRDDNEATMSLQGFDVSSNENEIRDTVLHETGHTLGFPHEHLRAEVVRRIDPNKAYEYYK